MSAMESRGDLDHISIGRSRKRDGNSGMAILQVVHL